MKMIMLALGGSVIHPDTGINTKFLSGFNTLLRKQIAKGRRFFIMVGGGHVGREYQYAARSIKSELANEDKNWLGIHGTRLNAQLVRTVFQDLAYPKLILDPLELGQINKEKVVIGAGSMPGASTDLDMVRVAERLKPELLISLLNVKMIYDADPKIFPHANPIPQMSWSDYQEMIGEWWNPERQLPFDPFAAQLAKNIGLKVILAEGRNIPNLENIFENKKFKATVIN